MATKTEIVATTGERLAEALELRHMNASELSKLVGISKSTISYYLKDKYTPKQDKIWSMAKHLNVSPSWLMGFNVDIDGTENENIVKEDNRDCLKIHTTIASSSQQFLKQAIALCESMKNTLLSSEDEKLLDRYHALAPDSQILVMSMIEKLLLTQESAMKGEAHEKKEETA